MDSTRIYLTIDNRRIAWLRFLLDSYEGLATMTTVDAASGRILLRIGKGAERETIDLLRAIKDEIGLVEGLSDDIILPRI